MRKWIGRVKASIQKWIQSRYGQDELYLFLLIVSFALLLLSSLSWVFYALTFVPLSLAVFRCCSKDVEKRRHERDMFLNIMRKPKRWAELQRLRWKDRKTHRYFKCSNCGQILRVPAGKGKIIVKCSRCHKEHIKKT